LKDAGQVIDELAGSLAPRGQERLIAAAGIQAERWPRMAASEQRGFILHVVAGVTVSEREILIELRRTALRLALLGEASSIDTASAPGSQAGMSVSLDALTLRVPVRLKLCSGEMRLVIPPGQGQELRPRPNATLIKALARAHRWKERLFSGGAPSTSAIAKEEGVTERYVSRIMRLAFLAPDIVEAILDGYQPVDLELERLIKGIPLVWEEQRRVFGFSRG
jgi:hypothetical protein